MLMLEVSREAAKAKAEGRRYLLVCMDLFDYYRGDHHYYYYPSLDSAAAVREYTANHQLGKQAWFDSHSPNDVWVAILDLRTVDSMISETDCQEPQRWLAANPEGMRP